MANYFNIFAGILAFLGSCTMVYALWTPVMSFLGFFPTTLYIMCGVLWVTICFASIVYLPFMLMISDDKGN